MPCHSTRLTRPYSLLFVLLVRPPRTVIVRPGVLARQPVLLLPGHLPLECDHRLALRSVLCAGRCLEALRALPFLKEGGTIVTDVREINPMPVLTGEAVYPHEAIDQLKEVVPNVIVVEAAKVAEELGNVKAQTIVLLGALVKQLALDNVDWRDLIAKNVPAKTVDLNLAAFDKGYNM